MVGIMCLLLLGFSPMAQDVNDIIGVWFTQDNDSKITIAKDDNGEAFGTITWIKEVHADGGQMPLDVNNPDETLRDKPLLGRRILNGFEYNQSRNRWQKGTIYDPTTRKTHKCQMWIEDDLNILIVRGYVGISLIGRQVEWTRDLAE